MQIRIRAIPGSAKFAALWRNGKLLVSLKSRAEGNKANAELLQLISKIQGVPVRIIKGQKSQNKVLELDCSREEFERKMKQINVK